MKVKEYQGYNIDSDLDQKRRLENGRYVFERVPQAAELESSENNIGNATNVVRRSHGAIQELEASETETALERRKRLREIADKIQPSEEKAFNI